MAELDDQFSARAARAGWCLISTLFASVWIASHSRAGESGISRPLLESAAKSAGADVPATMRWEPPWREKGDCGPIALYVLMRLIGRNVSLTDVKDRVGHDPELGCSLETLRRAAADLEFQVDVRFVTPSSLARVPRPFILHGRGGLQQKTGHYFVVCAHSKARSKARFAIVNVSTETLQWVPQESMERLFSGYVLIPKVERGAARWFATCLPISFGVIFLVLLVVKRRNPNLPNAGAICRGGTRDALPSQTTPRSASAP